MLFSTVGAEIGIIYARENKTRRYVYIFLKKNVPHHLICSIF